VRTGPDSCPGALTLHEAADGLLVRVRLPGGQISGPQLAAVAALAAEHGAGKLELTSRANLQLRGLSDGSAVADGLARVGLLPSPTHERVRNILASPLSGLDGSTDVSELVRRLDHELCSRPALAHLPGRFLFAVDDGRGDVAALDADVVLRPGARAADALDVAEAFLLARAEQGGTAWRIAELCDTGAALAAAAGPMISVGTALSGGPHRDHPVGVVTDGVLVVLAPLGRLGQTQAQWLAANAAEAEAYRGGKQGVLGFLVGQVMKETGGAADPRVVSERLREKLGA